MVRGNPDHVSISILTGLSEEHLSYARQLFTNLLGGSTQPQALDHKAVFEILADVNLIYSRLAMASGRPSHALLFARHSVRSSYRSYAIVERQCKKDASTRISEKAEYETEDLSNSMASLSVSDNSRLATTGEELPAVVKGFPFWTVLPRLYGGLTNLSQIYSHEGLFPEARAYAEEGQRLAQSINSASLLGRCFSYLGDYLTRSGDIQKGCSTLELAVKNFSGVKHDQHLVRLHLHLAQSFLIKQDPSSAENALALARALVEELIQSIFVENLLGKHPIAEAISHQMHSLKLKDTAPSKGRTKKGTPPEKLSKKSPVGTRRSNEHNRADCVSTNPFSRLLDTRCDIISQRGLQLVQAGRLDMAKDLALENVRCSTRAPNIVSHKQLIAYLSFRQGLEAMARDPVFCVLPESTTAFPSLNLASQPQSKASDKGLKGCRDEVKDPFLRADKKGKGTGQNTSNNFREYFREVQETIITFLKSARLSWATCKLHKIMDLLLTAQMILFTLNFPQQVLTGSFHVIYFMEMARSVSTARERFAIEVDRRASAHSDAMKWPDVSTVQDQGLLLDPDELEFVKFKQYYLDIIPESWQVISLSVSDNGDELRIARMRVGEMPFILSLPFNRHSSRDPDEATFGYNQAKAELQEIIGLANFSTHHAQDMSVKGAKAAWWSARAALDARLEDLLVNIENLWLGGFSGIFSQQILHSPLLARFQESLHRILNEHLPSRQSPGKKASRNRIDLDPRILELFVALHVPDDPADMDESLLDLLYFVIDILQFNGERNAYDEIDFDAVSDTWPGEASKIADDPR